MQHGYIQTLTSHVEADSRIKAAGSKGALGEETQIGILILIFIYCLMNPICMISKLGSKGGCLRSSR